MSKKQQEHLYLWTLLDQIFNRPHMITPGKAATIVNFLTNRIGVDASCLNMDMEAQMIEGENDERTYGPMTVTDGIALIPVRGTLTNRVRGLYPSSGMIGYNQIQEMALSAENDPNVQDAVFLFDTPGGLVTGAFETAEIIHNMTTRTWGVNESIAASAGYLLASAVDKLYVGEFTQTGNIGTLFMYRDNTKALAKQGVEYITLYAGKYKAEGAPGIGISEDMKAKIQAELDHTYDRFVETVAGYRDLTPEEVRDTNALTFLGNESISRGMADGIATALQLTANLREQGTQIRVYQQQNEKVPNVENLKAIAGQLGIDCASFTTGEQVAQAISIKVAEMKAQNENAISAQAKASLDAMMAKAGVKTVQDLQSYFATMVSREDFTNVENQLSVMKVESLLTEGKIAGKLTAADCKVAEGSETAGWAREAAMNSPEVFAKMLMSMPVKVPTGQAVSEFTASLQRVGQNGVQEQEENHNANTGKVFQHNELRYKMTADVAESYDDKDVENLADLVSKGHAELLITQGKIEPVV